MINLFTFKLHKKPAFTLIELLVTIVVLGVISGIVISVLNPIKHMETSRDSRRKSDLGSIQTALEMYYSENNAYPDSVPFGTNWEEAGVTYMRQVPQDPLSGQSYTYTPDGDRQGYTLCATLEETGSDYCVQNPY